MLHQEEEEAAEGAEEAEGESGAEDGPSGRLHRRHQRLIHVLTRHHQEASGNNPPTELYNCSGSHREADEPLTNASWFFLCLTR